MEDQLFEWSDWDSVDTFCMTFYRCILKVDIGTYPKGSIIPSIMIDFGQSLMVFYNNEGNETSLFNLKLSVV